MNGLKTTNLSMNKLALYLFAATIMYRVMKNKNQL